MVSASHETGALQGSLDFRIWKTLLHRSLDLRIIGIRGIPIVLFLSKLHPTYPVAMARKKGDPGTHNDPGVRVQALNLFDHGISPA
jgi:hypothetical protein